MSDYDRDQRNYHRYQQKVGQVGVWGLAIVTVAAIVGLVFWQLSHLAVVLVVVVGGLGIVAICGVGLWYATLSLRAAAAMRMAANPNNPRTPWWVGSVLTLLLAAVFLLFILVKRL